MTWVMGRRGLPGNRFEARASHAVLELLFFVCYCRPLKPTTLGKAGRQLAQWSGKAALGRRRRRCRVET